MNWKRVLGGLVTLLFLAPVPAYALIDFTGVSWDLGTKVGNGFEGNVSGNPFFRDVLNGGLITQTNTPGTSGSTVLTFTFPAQGGTTGVTTVQTASGITLGPSDTLHAVWSNLAGLNPSIGTMTVGIATSTDGGTTFTNNMFGSSAPVPSPFNAGNSSITPLSTAGTYIIKVSFDYSGGVVYSAGTTFTLTFSN
jgi:hypothetical protein